MLLYHFPLNTADNINNFTNVGLKNDYVVGSGFIQGDNGHISSVSADSNSDGQSCLRINNLQSYNKISIAFRFRFKSTLTSYQSLFWCNITPNNTDTNRVYIQATANSTACTIHVPTKSLTAKIFYPSVWYDVVFVKDGSTFSFYIDGNYYGGISEQNFYITNVNFCCRNIGGGGKCNSLIQDIRIYDYALSLAEINEYSRALVVHYPLQGNELNPSVLKDVSGFGNDYTLQGNNSYQLDSARGVKSLHTTDTAIYTQTPISSGYTTSFWCKYNEKWKHLCNNGSKYVDGVVNASQYDTIYATLTASGYDIVDYRVYATALSAEDIKNLYNSPISVSKQHQTMVFEFKEHPLYPSKYWRTPTYNEMNYILTQRTNASNLRTLGRVEISSGTYRNGLFLLPDGFVAPSGITVTIITANYTTNSYTLKQFKQLESVGVVFMPFAQVRTNTSFETYCIYQTGSLGAGSFTRYDFVLRAESSPLDKCSFPDSTQWHRGGCTRLIHNGSKFSTSATTKIDFAPANLQYHCTQHKWRFAEHSYDIIGAANANISDSYDGWIDLFGYGTSGVNYSPTLHTTNNADYASGDISNTVNDWGVNEIQSYDYNVQNFAMNKNGIVQHNELRENDSEVNGCYQDKIITNEIIEN